MVLRRTPSAGRGGGGGGRKEGTGWLGGMNKREGLWILKFVGFAETNDLCKRLCELEPLIDGDIAKP